MNELNDIEKIAVFFDAENFSSKYVSKTLAEINSRGNVVIQRTYSDWSSENVKSWKDCLSKYPLTAIQVFREKKDDKTDEKESVDKQIIMDAIETAVSNPDISIICIGASDKGYIPLALKLRELGKKVIGIGERQKAREGSKLVNACNEFLYVEDLKEAADNILLNPLEQSSGNGKSVQQTAETADDAGMVNYSLLNFLVQCYELTPKAANNAVLHSRFMETILTQKPDFSVKTYGFKTFRMMLDSFGDEFKTFDDGKIPPTYFAYHEEKEIKNDSKNEIKTGTVKRRIKNYGIILSNDNKEYYFYYGDVVNMPETGKISKDMKVKFTAVKEPDPNAELTKDRNGKAMDIEILA